MLDADIHHPDVSRLTHLKKSLGPFHWEVIDSAMTQPVTTTMTMTTTSGHNHDHEHNQWPQPWTWPQPVHEDSFEEDPKL